MINRKQQPELKKIESIDILEPETSRLDNDIPVYLFNAGDIGITKLDFIFEAGSQFQPYPLIASYTNKMLTEGTLSYSSFDIAQKLDYYGAYINNTTSKDTAVVSLSVLNKHLKYVLPVLNEIINHPKFPENELKIHTQKDKQGFIDDCLKVNDVAVMNFNRQLFGSRHPYGTLITAEDFDKQQTQQLTAFHKERYTAEHCKIIASGKMTKDIVSQLNYFFGYTKKAGMATNTKRSPKIIPGPKKQFIEMPSSVQSAIRIGKISINKAHKDYFKLYILNMIFGGYFGSRLMKNIREDKGYTYGIYSVLLSFQQSAAFIITSEVGADVCNKAKDEIYKEIRILNSETISNKELELVKKYLTGTLIRNFDGPFQIAERFKGVLEYGIDYKKHYADFLHTINTITPKELMLTSKEYLNAETMQELVVGKR
jgi:zinc protease